MRLSEAIALGRVLIEKPDSSSYCSCALAMGLASNGQTFSEAGAAKDAAYKEWPFIAKRIAPPLNLLKRMKTVAGPRESIEWIISLLFIAVEDEDISMEQLIDWVRSVEPQEETAEIAQETQTTLVKA